MIQKNTEVKLFVITGGPGAGKTTLPDFLETRGFSVVPESARTIIKNQVHTDGGSVPWKNKFLFARLMFSESLKAYYQASDKQSNRIVFFDRGLPDTLCYMKMENIPVSDADEQTVRETRYNNRVFMLPPWRKIYETDTERKQTWKEAVDTYYRMRETYTELGYEIITVPAGDIGSRYAFVIKHIY